MADWVGRVLGATALPSQSYTGTQTSADISNLASRYLTVVFDVTTIGTGNWTLTIQGKDPASGKYYTILAGAAVSGNSTNIYKVGPALTAAANAVANDMLPQTLRILVTANNTNASTFSVGYSLS